MLLANDVTQSARAQAFSEGDMGGIHKDVGCHKNYVKV
jgi:hypothetical protein